MILNRFLEIEVIIEVFKFKKKNSPINKYESP